MNARVRIRPEVPVDLESILDYFAQRSPAIADRFADAIAVTFAELAAMPGMGSPKSFRNKKLADIRSWSVPGFRNYLILYKPIIDGIEVVAVIHGHRDIRRLLKKRS